MGKKGKKAKKKIASARKQKRLHPHSEAQVGGHDFPKANQKTPCDHIPDCTVVGTILSKSDCSDVVQCEDCRHDVSGKRVIKGRSKQGRNKDSSLAEEKFEQKSLWVCLDCGHLSCGGSYSDTVPRHHAKRHAKNAHHPCAVPFENRSLCWCFVCNTVFHVNDFDVSGGRNDIENPKPVSVLPSKTSSGSVLYDSLPERNLEDANAKKSESASSILKAGGYLVKGLMNLGNTCFFNSVVQNILAIDVLRDYFLNMESTRGPLSMSFKNLFRETSTESDLNNSNNNVINPKIVFSCICSKAPQFRGYQQQDSHELLRYLLDGLCNEELFARKSVQPYEVNKPHLNSGSTFVDAIFGGQLSNTLCCMECGNSSISHEPFLDLSLPVPSKKFPPRKVTVSSRPKKTKLPMKERTRGRKIDSKEKPVSASLLSQIMSETTSSLSEIRKEQKVTPTEDLLWMDYIGANDTFDDAYSVSQGFDDSVLHDSANSQSAEDIATLYSESINKVDASLEEYIIPNKELESQEKYQCNSDLSLSVQNPKVLLLPYKCESVFEETTKGGKNSSQDTSNCEIGQDAKPNDLGSEISSPIDNELEEFVFDGFGGMFQEPETLSNPNFQENEGMDLLTRNSSEESNHEEVDIDHPNSPVSIDSCLSYFTKPELLTNEHAWQCESCSKILQHQKVEVRRQKVDAVHVKSTIRTSVASESSNFPLSVVEQDCLNSSSISICTELSDQLSSPFCSQKNVIRDVSELDTKKEIPSTNGSGSRVEYLINASAMSMDSINQSPIAGKPISTSIRSQTMSDLSTDVAGNNDTIPNTAQIDSRLSDNANDSDSSESDEIQSVKRDATKRILISKAPEILTIHLKRFSQDTRGRLRKLNGHISFHYTLDLAPYMDPRDADRSSCNYNLVGVVVHSGTMKGGHYVAYVRGGEKRRSKTNTKDDTNHSWFYACDSHVREASLAEVLMCEAYILFYEKM